MDKSSRQSLLNRACATALAALLLVPLSISTAAQELKALGTLLHARVPAQMAAEQPSGVADKYATVYGAKIHYLEAGSGPVVILLHGLGGDTSNWAPTIGALSRKYRVIVPDQIGFGKSDKPLMNYRVGTLVDFLAGFYKELKIDRASLVGNSLGGWTAAAFALAHPEKVDRLVLVDAAGFKPDKSIDPRTFNALNPSTREDVRKVLSMIFYNKAFAGDAGIDLMFARRIAAGDGYTIQRFIDSVVHGEDMLDGRLSALKHQTLILWGREDLLTPVAMGERFKREVPNSELVVFEKCGHVPQIEKAPEFNAAVLKFLGSGENAGK
ncbi:MAG TPA: alpha/beta fold hydrolase [Blastocatellia bacterium]|nr:alpha/beta fold hydrolase [Blastocatellia bacterium]